MEGIEEAGELGEKKKDLESKLKHLSGMVADMEEEQDEERTIELLDKAAQEVEEIGKSLEEGEA